MMNYRNFVICCGLYLVCGFMFAFVMCIMLLWPRYLSGALVCNHLKAFVKKYVIECIFW